MPAEPSHPALSVSIDRVHGNSVTTQRDLLAVEEPLEIQLVAASAADSAARSISITMRTPGNDIDLALGFLVTESIVRQQSDVHDAKAVGAATGDGLQNTVRVELKPDVDVDLARLERHFYTTSSCGVCGKASLDALAASIPSPGNTDWHIGQSQLVALPDALSARQSGFQKTGGLHAAAAFDVRGNLLHVREDVGRHNAVDKVVGALFADNALPADSLGLLVSGRASFELVQKALVAGMRALIAVSAPSSLAVQLASEHGLTLVGFLRGDGFNVYSGGERIVR